MAYIYKITNDVNQKIYIGKTEFSIMKRFQEHCQDAFRDRNKKRPLYAAMRKYGIEHFHIDLIEETDIPEERENYWIEYFGSFKNGYNATMGGDGRKYIDYDLVVATYRKIQSISETAKICQISVDSVSNILELKNVNKLTHKEVMTNRVKNVGMFCLKTNQLLKSFCSLSQAAEYCIQEKLTSSSSIKGVAAHIGKVCNGKRKQTLGYKWQFLE